MKRNLLSKTAVPSLFWSLAFLLCLQVSWGQVSITSTGTAFTQNFTIGTSGTAALPTGFKIGTDWSSGATATTLSYGSTGTGAVTGSSSGGAINWANGVTASSTERAIGFLSAGSYSSPRSIVYAFTNNTGVTVTNLDLSWNYEKYRSGTRAFDWTFFHGATSTAATAESTGNQSYPADANSTVISNPPLSVTKSVTISGVSIANGATYYLRWTYTGVGGSTNAKGLGIDDFSITATAPAPAATITPATSTLTAFTTTYGTTASPQTVAITGTSLAGVSITTSTAPTGYELSSDGTTYGTTATLASTGGTLYIRLMANAAVGGSYNSQTITLTSGSTTATVTTAASGNAVSAKALTISGLSGTNKTYDATTAASFTGTAAYVGLANGESFSVSGTPSAAFGTKGVGTAKTINITGYTAPSANYSLTNPAVTADITTASLSVTGASGTTKEYDATTAATISGGALSGVLLADAVTLTNGAATFAQATIGTALAITPNFSLSGTDAGNYSLAQPSGISADITAKSLSITGLTADSKIYDGTTTATLSGTPSLVGVVAADSANVTLGGTVVAHFVQTTVGTGIAVTVSGYALGGSASANYVVAQPAGLTADITSSATPVITSTLTATATYGVAATLYTITASNGPTSFSATGLPAGLSLNTSSGAITGTPTATPGDYNVTLSANNAGGSGTEVLVYTITAKTLSISGAAANSKEYDATNEAFFTGTLVGVVGADTVSFVGTGTFASANAGSGWTVTATASLTGADSAKYVLTQPTGLTADITTIGLDITGVAAANKEYNGTTAATLSGTASLIGVLAPDGANVSLDVTAVTASFVTATVGTAKTVNASGYSLSGSAAVNYVLNQPSGLTANITTKAVTLSGLSANSKAYDQSAAATLSGSAVLNGVAVLEDVSLSGTATASFANATVGTAKVVTVAGYSLSGADAANYTLTSPTFTANITALSLTVTGITANSKPYDGTTAATLSGTAVVSGTVLGGDTVTLGGTASAAFASANAGTGIAVTVTGYTLSGAEATNYILSQPSGVTADITSIGQTITFGALANKLTTDAAFALTATASSGLAITYSSSNTAVATVAGSTLTIVGVGTTTITAAQAGNANYSAAASVPQTLTVTVAPVVLAGWDFTGIGGTTNTTVAATTFNANLVSTSGASNISRGAGAPWSTAANSFRTTGFQNNGIATTNTDYFQTTLTAAAGKVVSLTAINANLNGTTSFIASPGVSSQFAYSLNGTTFTLIGSPTVTIGTPATLSINLSGVSALQNVAAGTTITFRYYASGQTTTGGWGFLSAASAGTNGLAFSGNITAIPAPVITSSLTASATVGTAFTYTTVASNTPTSYAATSLPAGLSINTATGVITGTPTEVGTANVSLSATNNTGTDTQTLVITTAQGSQTITFNALSAVAYGAVPFALTATASSALAITYSSSDTGVATVSGNTVTIVGAGTTTITASQAGNANYAAATSVDQVLTVNKADQTITFGTLADKLDTDVPFVYTATASSGLAVAYSSSNTGIITLAGSTATITGSGTAVITASQAGNANYNAATAVDQNQLVTSTALANQTLTFGALAGVTYGDAPFALTATSDAGLTVAYSSSDAAIASVSGATVTIHQPGTVTITALQAGNASYNPATSVDQALVISPKTLTVSDVVVADKNYDGTTAGILSAATLNGVVGADTVSLLSAPVFADANVGTGIAVTPNFSLTGAEAGRYLLTQPTGSTGTIVSGTQTITFGALTPVTYGDAPFALTATGGLSGNAITYVSSDPLVASISGTTVTVLAAGTVTITASQAGNTSYSAADDVPQTLLINKKAQTISFAALATKYTTDVPFTLTATSTSLGTVSFASSNSAVATVSGTTVTIVGAGTTNITASQAGDANFAAAVDVVRALVVNLPPIAAWDVFGLSGTATATATTFTDLETAGSLNNMTRGSGAVASTATNTFRTTGFSNNGIATSNTDYFQVTLQASSGNRLSLTTLDAVLAGTASFAASPGVSSQFAYSLDGTTFTLIGSPQTIIGTPQNLSQIDLSGITALQNVPNGTTITMRYYASGQTTTGGWGFASATAGTNALSIGGTVLPVSVTWDGTTWSNTTGPDTLTEAVIAGTYATTTDGVFASKKITVNSGSLTVNSGTNLTVQNEIINNTAATAVVVENNANLIQVNTVANTGSITVKRNSAALMRQDYTLWASPVSGPSLKAFSPATLDTRFYTYNPATDFYTVVASPSATNFATGKGYLIRMPNTHPTAATVWNGTFTGVPNNGEVNLSVTNATFNAIGNPYPSAIDADTFITDNNLAEALYFWRKTNGAGTSSYATYTKVGGTGTTASNGNDPLALTPNGIIQVGQGFIAKATSTSLNFTNSMRVANNGNQFLRTGTASRSRIWLSLANASGFLSQTLLAYFPSATSGVDAAIDGRYYNDSPTALTSIINNEEFSIQGRGLPFETNDVVALGFKTATAGTFAIAIDQVDGLFSANQAVYLKDTFANTVHPLSTGSYTFASEAGVFNSRFEVVYQNPLAVSQPKFNANSVVVYKQNQELVVSTSGILMASVKVFDLQGRLLVAKNNINASETRLVVGTSNQVLLVQIASETEGTLTKKVVN